jgi:hypothetical protein
VLHTSIKGSYCFSDSSLSRRYLKWCICFIDRRHFKITNLYAYMCIDINEQLCFYIYIYTYILKASRINIFMDFLLISHL